VSLTCLESWCEDKVRRRLRKSALGGVGRSKVGQIGWYLKESTSQENREL